MKPSKPWNITTMDVETYIKNEFVGEVTSPMMYEPSSTSFHPFGMYSERIFGQVGTPERISKLGYISLHCDILSPIIYLNIISVCSWYKELMEGKIYAIYDEKEKAFIVVTKETPNAKTGFAFFMDHATELEYQKNESHTRTDKIDVIAKSIKDGTCFIRQHPVCPAGWRDVKTDTSGRLEVDTVNKLYISLLVMSSEVKSSHNSPVLSSFFDNVKYHIQLKVVELFNHWKDFYSGKTGFGQAHYSKRNLALGTRGVITAPPMIAASPSDPGYIKHNDTHIPLFHCAKAFSPVVVHALNVLFTSQIYTLGSIQVPAIDPKTLEIRYVEVSGATVTYALDSKSKHDFINAFSNTTGRHDPVTIESVDGNQYWMWMVYDLGDQIYIFRNLKDLKELLADRSLGSDELSTPENSTPKIIDIDSSKIRPLTKIEMLYIATHKATKDKFVEITRFPAVEVGSTYPSQVVVMSTSPSRNVTFKSQYQDSGGVQLPQYPVFERMQYIDSTIIHPSKTSGLGADYDGDKVSVNGIMSSEALQECADHLNSPSNLISPGGKFYDTLSTKVVRFSIHALTRLPPSIILPKAE